MHETAVLMQRDGQYMGFRATIINGVGNTLEVSPEQDALDAGFLFHDLVSDLNTLILPMSDWLGRHVNDPGTSTGLRTWKFGDEQREVVYQLQWIYTVEVPDSVTHDTLGPMYMEAARRADHFLAAGGNTDEAYVAYRTEMQRGLWGFGLTDEAQNARLIVPPPHLP